MDKAIKRYWPVFVLPTMLAFTIGFVAPFILGIYLSFCKFTTVTDAKWVTIEQFLEMKENKEMISTIDFGREEYNCALEKIDN